MDALQHSKSQIKMVTSLTDVVTLSQTGFGTLSKVTNNMFLELFSAVLSTLKR